MGYGAKHVRFSADRPVFRGRDQHYLRSGRPKIRYEHQHQAQAVVMEMRGEGKDVQSYQCRTCQGFHVGNRRHIDIVPDRDIAMFTELGDRAFAHLRSQNRQRRRRMGSVLGVLRRAEDKRLWGTNNVTPESHAKFRKP